MADDATSGTEGAVALTKVDLKYWQDRWRESRIGWHREKVSDLLDMYHSDMMPKEGEGRVFFPLCGKTVDMRYMAERGYDVIGVESTKGAIIDFFNEQQLEYSMTMIKGFIAFATMDRKLKITIYNGDFFKVTPTIFAGEDGDGKFDAIWDRGSLVAMNPSDRSEYARVITSLMTPQTRYMIAALSYDQSRHGGPPFSTPLEVVRELFGADCNMETKHEAPNNYSMNRFKLDWWLDSLYLLVRK